MPDCSGRYHQAGSLNWRRGMVSWGALGFGWKK